MADVESQPVLKVIARPSVYLLGRQELDEDALADFLTDHDIKRLNRGANRLRITREDAIIDNGSESVAEQWRFATVRDSTADEIASLLAGLLALRGLGFGDIGGLILTEA